MASADDDSEQFPAATCGAPVPAIISAPQGTFERVVERVMSGGLPEVIAGPGGKAISRLIGGVADVPAAWLEQQAQAIRDQTAGKSEVMRALSSATAKNVSTDQAVIERAKSQFLGKLYIKQVNRENIANKATELLLIDPADSQDEIDGDWLNLFEIYAEQASSERLRETWARILAGEIRKPKSFSLRTIQFVSTLGQDDARKFEQMAKYICNRATIYLPNRFGFKPEYGLLSDLREVGLIGSDVANRIPVIQGNLIIGFHGAMITVPCANQGYVELTNAPLTKVGLELYELIGKPVTDIELQDTAQHIAEFVRADHYIILRQNSIKSNSMEFYKKVELRASVVDKS